MNPYVEKVLWMIVPLLFSAVTYQWTKVQTMQEKILELEAKLSLVVSKDNKVIPSIEAELAREKLRQDMINYDSNNRERIVVLEQQMKNKK